ncbi:MAG: glycosyltransferase family 39 protein [Gemmatimonadales bacterium]
MQRRSPPPSILLAILALGAVLRAWQYLGDPSLWADELALARQIIDRPMLDLLSRPLDYNQAAPSGFLVLMKAVTALFGDSEYALRLVPFVASLASLPVFLALASRILPPLAQAPALFFFAVAPNLILRAAEVKQYSTDVLAATAVVLLALRWLERPTRGRGWALGAALAIGAWCSHPLIFVGAGVLLPLAVDARRRQALRDFLPGVAAVAVSVLGAALLALLEEGTGNRASMAEAWRSVFMPWEPVGAAVWAWERIPRPFVRELGVSRIASLGFAALVPLGWLALTRARSWITAGVIAGPVLVTILAAALHVYPFANRLVSFLFPLAIIAIGAALGAAGNRLRQAHPALALLVWVAVVPIAIVAVERRPVLRRQEARQVFDYIAAHRRPGDPVYVYFTGWHAAAYYAPRARLDSADVVIGRCFLGNLAGYHSELARLAGARPLWVFFVQEPGRERRQLLAHLRQVGVVRDSILVKQWPRSAVPSASAWQVEIPDTLAVPRVDPAATSPVCGNTGPGFPVDSLIRGGRRLPSP